jgi:polysaccharide export outer membrane protein
MRLGFLACVALLAVACGGSVPPYDYTTEPDPRGTEFVIGPLDVLQVSVWKNKELSADAAVVRPDGVFTLPLIGDVKAAGRTPTSVQKEIVQRLSAFIRAEELVVSVAVTQVNSYHFTVMGAVERGGYFTSRQYVTALEALALAGGPNRFAGNTLYILRGKPQRKIPIDIKRATSGKYDNENLVVLAGDVLVMQ